jgi:ribosomal protein S18 acetylase RimI-like enzyme
MLDKQSNSPPLIRLATPDDIEQIEELDRLSTSPTRNIPREMEKYFGSVDPTTHERTLIFLSIMDDDVVAGKAELMLPPQGGHGEGWQGAAGYIKRVIVRPEFRQLGLARNLMQHIIEFAHAELRLSALDLHVWEMNLPAIRLYESLGFELQHRELYFRLPL